MFKISNFFYYMFQVYKRLENDNVFNILNVSITGELECLD